MKDQVKRQVHFWLIELIGNEDVNHKSKTRTLLEKTRAIFWCFFWIYHEILSSELTGWLQFFNDVTAEKYVGFHASSIAFIIMQMRCSNYEWNRILLSDSLKILNFKESWTNV